MKEMKLVFEVPDIDGTHRKVMVFLNKMISSRYDWIDYEQKKEAEYEKKRIIYLGEKRSK